MQPHWIIENLTSEPSYEELIAAVKDFGYPITVIKGDYKKSDLDHIDSRGCIVCNGSIEMVKLIQEKLPNVCPGAYCNFQKYLCSNYYSHFGEHLFNDHYAIVSLSELNRRKYFYYGLFGKEAMLFVRPNSSEKLFQAPLLDLLDFDRFYERHADLRHELVVVSSPKTIRGEWRYVVDRSENIIAKSCYRYQDQITKIPSAPTKATEFVREMLKVGYFPDSVFCIDVCEDNDGNYWLLELTSFSSAGLYACDKTKIVKWVSEFAVEDWFKKNLVDMKTNLQ